MSLKRSLVESAIRIIASCGPAKGEATNPQSVFVLRNNDIGDLLVVTPLFEALKKRFPEARIAAGVGEWNRPVLENNPHLHEILTVNAPWHNKQCGRFARNSLRGLWDSVRYIYSSSEVGAIRSRRFDVGIDVLGSPEGSLLLMRAGIPYRLGVRGYAGGHSAAQACVSFNSDEHVGRSALRFAELLGARELPEYRPQIYLTSAELEAAEARWQAGVTVPGRRVVIGPGAGFVEKCWPLDRYIELAGLLRKQGGYDMAVVGSASDKSAGAALARIPSVRSFAGLLGLRETFAMVAQADLVICNSSMLMHVAAAFSKPALVLLGEWYPSARGQARQWGDYPRCRVFGKGEGRSEIYSVAEALDALRDSNFACEINF
ncbi:MAG: glycosyltransferase family 9 protein [Verrucomicrobiota bacterium]